ncbi:MAG TPA: hypothetical protein PKA42_03480 [Candidatus Paceibacterota bacterium]|nr:hypothetical protein [Candidatus Paceibacterota bacterium]HMO83204.1 hypothetical protein [Candidatus Paceibacterota bacterium]
MEPEIISSRTVEATSTRLNPGGIDIVTPLGDALSQSSFFNSLSFENIASLLNTIWLVYVIFAYLFSIFLLVVYIYGSIGKKKIADLENELRERKERLYQERFHSAPKNHRLEDMIEHSSSDNPTDWKLAIIEADIILDEMLKDAGYGGASLGERLKSISPNHLQSLDDAWQAHKVRNQIAHGGADFILTQRLAQDTIKQYRRVFYELGLH